MKVVAYLSQKGGAGKTTLAVHTAVAAHEAGCGSVVVIDTDPQKSATVWGEARRHVAPIVATADVSELGRVLKAAHNEGIALAVVDAAPHAAPAAATIARAAGLVAIPCRPTAFDLNHVQFGTRSWSAWLGDGRFPYDGFPERPRSDWCCELIMNAGARR